VVTLQALIEKHGDLPVVVCDAGTRWLIIPHVEHCPAHEDAAARLEISGHYDCTTRFTPD